MLKARYILPVFVFVPILFFFTKCKKDHTALSITLYDKPLSTIQSYTKGKWVMIYLQGGFSGGRLEADPGNYLILSPERIVFGNDATGVILDTTITWSRARFGSDSTYLLDYLSSPDFPLVRAKVVDRIFNDTLILSDYSSSEPYYYHYIKR
ncbi:MAG: hypothetical protein ACHQDF_00010 [Chitinophagales bacterium]